MPITQIVQTPVALHRDPKPDIANAVVDVSQHSVSLVAVVSDVIRNGKPVSGVAFDSIGRFAQSGILADRMIPRMLDADPGQLADDSDTSMPSSTTIPTARAPAVTRCNGVAPAQPNPHKYPDDKLAAA